jgi:hypothetical protein
MRSALDSFFFPMSIPDNILFVTWSLEKKKSRRMEKNETLKLLMPRGPTTVSGVPLYSMVRNLAPCGLVQTYRKDRSFQDQQHTFFPNPTEWDLVYTTRR